MTSVQRNVVVRINSGRSTEDETFAANVEDHRLLCGAIDLATQPAYVDIDEIALGHEPVVPAFLEQHRPRQQLVFATHHVFEQTKFAWQQFDRAIAAPSCARQRVELE